MRIEDLLPIYMACDRSKYSERKRWRKRDARKFLWGVEFWEFVHVVIAIYTPRKDVPNESHNS